MRTALILALAALAAAALTTPAAAGDPERYADRTHWPEWSTLWGDPEREYPEGGELVDAIRFELIRGYLVEAKDYLEYEDREFKPTQAITRAEFAAVLSRSQSLATEDAKTGPWYAPYIAALKEKGMIPEGASEAWSEAITRREAGQWMGRAAEAFNADDNPDGMTFSDVSDPLILRALRAGIVKGTGEGRFEPDRALLRVEAAVMLVRLARARNSLGNAERPEVLEELAAVIKEADRQGAIRGKRWVIQGYLDEVETGGVLTQEFAEWFYIMARESIEARDIPPRSWAVRVESEYNFELLEGHDTIALVKVCGLGQVFRAEDPPDRPWFTQRYCGYQFMVKRGDQWLVAAASDRLGEQ